MGRFIAALVLLAVGFSTAGAQVRYSTDKFYLTKEACLAGPRNYYESIYRSDFWKNPVGGNIVRAPLESDACVNLHVVGGYAWVWQRAGTQYRWRRNADGTLSILSRDDCGNLAPEIAYPSPTPAGPIATHVGVTKGDRGEPGAKGDKGDRGDRGYAGKDFSWKPVLVTGGILGAIGAIVYAVTRKHDKPAPPPPPPQGPGVKSDSSKTICTGTPCPGIPMVFPLRAGPGLMVDPINRSVGWRFALPRR